MLLPTSASLLSNPDSKTDLTNTPSPSLQPRSLGLHRDTLSNSDRFTTGPFKVYMLKSIALIPLNIAAHAMSDFFTVVAQACHVQKLAGRITSHYDFGFGAITKFLNMMPATADAAAPPLDWDLCGVDWVAADGDDESEVDGAFRGGDCGSGDQGAAVCDAAGDISGVDDDWFFRSPDWSADGPGDRLF